ANVRKARSLGVPVLRLPIDVNNVFWTLLQPHIWKVLDSLPIRWSAYPHVVRYLRRGWYMHAKAEAHELLGPAWALVTPMQINIHVADPDAIQDMFSRRGDFQRPGPELKLLELYGPCISTASWEEWPRHRKPIATPFNETVMKPVWDESLRQARGMLSSWVAKSEHGIPSYQEDARMLSLNVLAGIGFGSTGVAKVEQVAVLACLFKAHRLAIKTLYDGESLESVYKRFEKCVNDIDLEMLVRLRDGDQVTVVCTQA
ncbi:hypothetical protein PG997_000049, partial [Apiospora hydei]